MKEKQVSAGIGGESAARVAAVTLFWVVMGLISPRVSVYGGLSPFGVGVAAAAAGPGALLAYAATAVGYLLGGDTLFLIRYLAAVAIAGGLRWAFNGVKGIPFAKWLPPAAAFVAVITAGFAVQVAGKLGFYALVALLCEGVLAAGFTWVCTVCDRLLRRGPEEERRLLPSEQMAAAMLAAVAVMALTTLQVGGISLGRILAAVAVLLFARSGKEQGGGLAGAVLGAALVLTDPTAGTRAAAFAFGGVTAGVFARLNRFAAAGTYLILSVLVVMAGGDGVALATAAYEGAIAGVLFLLLPTSLDRRINGFFLRGQELPAVEGLRRSVVWRLDYAARAMGEVAGTVDEVSRRMADISAPDLGSLCRQVSEEICARCPRHVTCWDGGYADTMASFNAMTDLLREEGRAARDRLTGRLAECPSAEEILSRVNGGYARFLVRESAFRRLAEIRGVAGDQFYAMASMLEELSGAFSDPAAVDESAAVRVRELCDQYGLPAEEVLCTRGRGGRLEIQLMVGDADLPFDERAWRREVGEACGCRLQPPRVERIGSTARMTLREQPRYRVEVGRAQLCCSGEKLCGDAFEIFTDAEGRRVAVLSDGMGCGGRAAVDGAMTAGLTARLLQAGFGPDSVLRMVNGALMVKSGDETLATLDVAVIDPFSGALESLKAGAAASLLRSGGRISRIDRSSLPLGILREVSFERSRDTLVGGDVLLLFSDGAVSESGAAAEEILMGYDPERSSLQNLAEQVASTARRLQQAKGGHEDDITVLAVGVYNTGEEGES